MNQVWHFAKLAISVVCGIVGIVAVGFFKDYALANTCFFGSIAFSIMPE